MYGFYVNIFDGIHYNLILKSLLLVSVMFLILSHILGFL